MFDYITRHRKLIQVLIFLFIIPPFVFFGVDRLQSPVGAGMVAKVGGYSITQQEFNRALRERQEAIQRVSQGRAAPELLDSTELRSNVLEALIRQRQDALLRSHVRTLAELSPYYRRRFAEGSNRAEDRQLEFAEFHEFTRRIVILYQRFSRDEMWNLFGM